MVGVAQLRDTMGTWYHLGCSRRHGVPTETHRATALLIAVPWIGLLFDFGPPWGPLWSAGGAKRIRTTVYFSRLFGACAIHAFARVCESADIRCSRTTICCSRLALFRDNSPPLSVPTCEAARGVVGEKRAGVLRDVPTYLRTPLHYEQPPYYEQLV